MKRFAATLGTVALLSSSMAIAHICTVAKKPVGAGSAGVATIDVATGEADFSGVKMNANGRPVGGFITIEVSAGGQPIGTVDTFGQVTLPEGAMNSGPGETQCDGVGIDNAEACLTAP